MNYSAERLLEMDYSTLQKYASDSVLIRPSLIAQMKAISLKRFIDNKTEIVAPSYIATVRCLCAFIGISDPCR